MLGKYGRYNELKNGDDYEEWLEGYKWGVTEMGEDYNQIQHFEAATALYPELRAISVSLAVNEQLGAMNNQDQGGLMEQQCTWAFDTLKEKGSITTDEVEEHAKECHLCIIINSRCKRN